MYAHTCVPPELHLGHVLSHVDTVKPYVNPPRQTTDIGDNPSG